MTATVHPLTGATWTDDEGHPWPVTGAWCTACGLPLVPVDRRTTHPTCGLLEATR